MQFKNILVTVGLIAASASSVSAQNATNTTGVPSNAMGNGGLYTVNAAALGAVVVGATGASVSH
ncbi:hypothetical protein NADFUDRAFT_52999 [Nadsonia fulvescens var. elongata DSM 6958]|uniref:Uncharacterized protein n=1 Tax=Nadsonia fulvescens var. elongata DSM 6958 TaxID=857566 RepID=A0A1E3PFN0_9ASCO|nr:hypothetical protein NADFUDRAFT_52999 [Nadsonia fulvescens var. elongata DSM 6958]